MTEKNYGVYFEYVIPKTIFFETRASTPQGAEELANRQFKELAGYKVLEVFPIKNTPTHKPKEASQLILPNQKQ